MKDPRCELCPATENVLVLRNGSMICKRCRRRIARLLAPVGPSKPVCKKRAKPRRGPLRDPGYRRWCSIQWCVVCRILPEEKRESIHWPIDPAHTENNGMRSKGRDSSCAPLCRAHHRQYDAGREAFEKTYGVDMKKLAAAHYARYQSEK